MLQLWGRDIQLEMSNAGGLLLFGPAGGGERLRSCSVGCTSSLLIEGNARPCEAASLLGRLVTLSSLLPRWPVSFPAREEVVGSRAESGFSGGALEIGRPRGTELGGCSESRNWRPADTGR